MSRPTIWMAKQIVRSFVHKEGNIAGGSLHVVLEDGNTDIKSVVHCREYAQQQDDSDGVFVANILAMFTRSEREDIVSNWHMGDQP